MREEPVQDQKWEGSRGQGFPKGMEDMRIYAWF